MESNEDAGVAQVQAGLSQDSMSSDSTGYPSFSPAANSMTNIRLQTPVGQSSHQSVAMAGPHSAIISHSAAALQSRRSSCRSIKRKKFDDELVESSLVKTSRGGGVGGGGGRLASSFPMHGGQQSMYNPPLSIPESVPVEIIPVTPSEHKKKSPKPPAKRVKKSRSTQALYMKDIGRWKATDDLALILSVQQTNDLQMVYQGVKFSCKFTLQEIQERWYALLYNPGISKMAMAAMKQLHPEIIATIQSQTLFSKTEEEILAKITVTSQPTLATFQELLNQHVDKFYQTRTAKSLQNHWLLMRQHHLLCDQKLQPAPQEENILNFSDAEDMLNDDELTDPKDDALEKELSSASRRTKSEIRRLENELPKWQVLVDTVTGISPPDFDNHTLAVLRGRLVRYLMRSREITMGRATKDNSIDVDLSLEGPALKVSRLQGIIRLRNNGDFFIANEGKRLIYVDGKPVLKGNKFKLNHNSVVEVAGLRFIFLVNHDLINLIRGEASKLIA